MGAIRAQLRSTFGAVVQHKWSCVSQTDHNALCGARKGFSLSTNMVVVHARATSLRLDAQAPHICEVTE